MNVGGALLAVFELQNTYAQNLSIQEICLIENASYTFSHKPYWCRKSLMFDSIYHTFTSLNLFTL